MTKRALVEERDAAVYWQDKAHSLGDELSKYIVQHKMEQDENSILKAELAKLRALCAARPAESEVCKFDVWVRKIDAAGRGEGAR